MLSLHSQLLFLWGFELFSTSRFVQVIVKDLGERLLFFPEALQHIMNTQCSKTG